MIENTGQAELVRGTPEAHIAVPRTRFWSRLLLAALLLAFATGMLCMLIIPAWWHYDEPGHFEYVWLAAHSPTWPVPGQYDQAIRRQMALSMEQNGWYRIRNFKLDLQSDKPIPIGVTQVGDQPGYYFLASLPLRLMPGAGITSQYYVARLMSLFLFLLLIPVVWFACGEFLDEAHPLRWMATIFVALLPAFVDTMVSVNNDVSAVLAASLFFWASIRLIRRGYSAGRLLFLAISLVACYFSKSTAWFAFPLTPLVLVLGLLRGKLARGIWAAIAVVVLGGSALALNGGAPKAWYQPTLSSNPVRVHVTNGPLGEYAFGFDTGAANAGNVLMQLIPPEQVRALRGQTATLGAWVWASEPMQAGRLWVRFTRDTGDTSDSPPVSPAAVAQPAFYQASFAVPEDAISGVVLLRQAGGQATHNMVFFDGLVFTPGTFAGNTPQFSDASGSAGTWNGKAFHNMLRNPSAEAGSFQLRKWLADKTSNLATKAGMNFPLLIATVQDWDGAGWYYGYAVDTLFRTFWASLAGDKAFLASVYASDFLVVWTILAAVGAVIRLWRRRKDLHWNLVGFLGLCLLIPWLFAMARGGSDLLEADPLVPWARYAYPAILPTALFLCAGWLEWLEIAPFVRKFSPATRQLIFAIIMTGISVFALVNAIQVFHPGWWIGWVPVGLLFFFELLILRFFRQQSRLPAP